MAQDKYIIGDTLAPYWCKRYLMLYRKKDGSIGYEFFGKNKSYELEKGDCLLYDEGKIKVRKRFKE